jgi:acyl-CoA synthetase (AMP-forming)/AMP-acid ligase II
MSSYWRNPEKTAETLVDGWHTGDLAQSTAATSPSRPLARGRDLGRLQRLSIDVEAALGLFRTC